MALFNLALYNKAVFNKRVTGNPWYYYLLQKLVS